MRKFKKRRKKLYTRKIFLLNSILVVFLFLGLGYSILNTELFITGSLKVKAHLEPTLYNVLKAEATSGGLAKEYTGEHQDSMDPSLSTKKIYHWYANNDTEGTAIQNKFNVIFADHCWQMIRTTDTGGVKMIYNGEAEDGKCLDTRGTHIGYSTQRITSMGTNYWYGTEYTYDSSTNTFKVSGETEQATWNETTAPGLIGKYTCRRTNVDATCSTLYYVCGYNAQLLAYVFDINANIKYYNIGNIKFNLYNSSPSAVGYMHNTVYQSQKINVGGIEEMLKTSSLGTSYWYAPSVTWGSPTADKYNLDNPFQVSSTDDYPSLVGKYTFRNNSSTYTNTIVNYIAAVDNTTMYSIQISNQNGTPHDLSYFDYTYTYGDSYTDNGDGTYTINNPTTINRKDWYTVYSNVGENKYVCKDAVNDTCSELWYTTTSTKTSMYYTIVKNYKYANGYTWDGSKYILDNDTAVTFWNINDSANRESLKNAHYTCWDTTGECTSVSYFYNISDTAAFYINLTDGKSVEAAVNEMLYNNDVNTNNSTIKTVVDKWYKEHLLQGYDDYIEDTIFCNNRKNSNNITSGWNPNGGSISNSMYFQDFSGTNLRCQNETDKFSVSNPVAKLSYKVGLMTKPEMAILNNSNARKVGGEYALLTPYLFQQQHTETTLISSEGNLGWTTGTDLGVRPAISLKPGIEYISGDDSKENPYTANTLE